MNTSKMALGVPNGEEMSGVHPIHPGDNAEKKTD